MKTVIVLCMCMMAAFAAPSRSEGELATAARRALPAVLHEEVHDKLGQYTLRYVTAEGTIVMETGELVPNADGSGLVLVTKGEVSYVGDDGKTYVTKYTAGLDGYNAEGDHLPKDVEIPAVPAIPAPSA